MYCIGSARCGYTGASVPVSSFRTLVGGAWSSEGQSQQALWGVPARVVPSRACGRCWQRSQLSQVQRGDGVHSWVFITLYVLGGGPFQMSLSQARPGLSCPRVCVCLTRQMASLPSDLQEPVAVHLSCPAPVPHTWLLWHRLPLIGSVWLHLVSKPLVSK